MVVLFAVEGQVEAAVAVAAVAAVVAVVAVAVTTVRQLARGSWRRLRSALAISTASADGRTSSARVGLV